MVKADTMKMRKKTMQTSNKHTPKSCSCTHCTRGKHSSAGRANLKSDQRAYRHDAKIQLAKLDPEDLDACVIQSAPIGNYYD